MVSEALCESQLEIIYPDSFRMYSSISHVLIVYMKSKDSGIAQWLE